MKTRLLILLLITLVPLQIQDSFACECVPNASYSDIVDQSDLVFIGTVNSIVDGENYEHREKLITLDVHSIAKGELAYGQVTTKSDWNSCSVDYKIGTTYVVVIYDAETMSTGICSTVPLKSIGNFNDIPDSVIMAMGEPEVPDLKNNSKLVCYGGPGMILNDQCQEIGSYDPQTGIPIVNNKEECDKLDGTWYDDRKLCDSQYAPVEYRFQFGPEPEPPLDPDNLCPPGKVFDWDICVDECPSGTINNNGICQGFEHVGLSLGVGMFGLILIFIAVGTSAAVGFIIWRIKK